MKKSSSGKKVVLKYKKTLDQDRNLEKIAHTYDQSKTEQTFDFSRAIRQKGEIKRVNMQIPFDIYLDAIKIGELSGTGYQNTLKIAITIGLEQLRTMAGLNSAHHHPISKK